MLDERSVQTVSTPFYIFKNKENVESMLNKSLNQFKFDSTHFQQACKISCTLVLNVERPVQTGPRHLLKQMLKPFKRALSCCPETFCSKNVYFNKPTNHESTDREYRDEKLDD